MKKQPLGSISQLITTRYHKFVYYILRIYFGLMRRVGFSTTLPFFVRFPFRYKNKDFDFFLKYQLDFDLIRDTFITEEYLLDDTKHVQTVFDLGSNIGATVIFFKLLWPDATVYAFEPDPRNVESLRKNVAQFGESVIVIEKAVVPSPINTVTFYQAKKRHWSSSTIEREDATKKLIVPAVTLHDVINQYSISHIDICKFDIEGAEYEIFRNFEYKNLVQTLIGELHYSLMKHTKDEFNNLFSEHDLVETRQGEVVVLHKQSKIE